MGLNVVALRDGIGRFEADGTVATLDTPYPSLVAYLRDGGRLTDLDAVPVRGRSPLNDASVAPAAGPGSSVWGVGLNYRSKLLASGREVPDHPVLFVKGPGSICSGREPVVLPEASTCVDYEGEIAVLVSTTLYQSTAEQVRRTTVGITAANDITARDVMRWSRNPSLAKSFAGFGQLGSVIEVSAGPWLEPVPIQVHVNGGLRQSDRSDGMLLPIDELLAMISRYTPLRPGDVVLTGTPAGTGDEVKTYLQPDDIIEVSVAELPALASKVVASDRALDDHPG